ncbi:hypothetical protein EV182_006373, partial [Spiromyces aspiralis]
MSTSRSEDDWTQIITVTHTVLSAWKTSNLQQLYSISTTPVKERINFLGPKFNTANIYDHGDFDMSVHWQMDSCGQYIRNEWDPTTSLLAMQIGWIG